MALCAPPPHTPPPRKLPEPAGLPGWGVHALPLILSHWTPKMARATTHAGRALIRNLRGQKYNRSYGKNLPRPSTRLAHGVISRWQSNKWSFNGLDVAPRAQRNESNRIESRSRSRRVDESVPVAEPSRRVVVESRRVTHRIELRDPVIKRVLRVG